MLIWKECFFQQMFLKRHLECENVQKLCCSAEDELWYCSDLQETIKEKWLHCTLETHRAHVNSGKALLNVFRFLA